MGKQYKLMTTYEKDSDLKKKTSKQKAFAGYNRGLGDKYNDV